MSEPGSTTGPGPGPGPTRDGRRDLERRRAMLQATLERWLKGGGAVDAARQRQIPAALAALDAWPGVVADPRVHGLEQLVAWLHTAVPAGTGALPYSASELGPAFARALVAQAIADVEFEAFRAGHGSTFAALRPWLENDLAPAGMPALAQSIGLTEAALATALRRLRRRFRQRIDSGLALWSASPAQHDALRREMHAALTAKELAP